VSRAAAVSPGHRLWQEVKLEPGEGFLAPLSDKRKWDGENEIFFKKFKKRGRPLPGAGDS